MEKIRLDILGLSSSQSQVGSFALVLGERDGSRRLPIIIGGFEAQAIALEMESIKPNRPMTHDLVLTITRTFGIGLKEVIINDLHEGVFFSKLIMYQGDEEYEIDSRPSDAIAIAVRYQAPIYTYEKILSEAGIVIKEEDDQEVVAEKPAKTPAKRGTSKNDRIEELTQKIEEAIAREDYETAARLRDEIKKLED